MLPSRAQNSDQPLRVTLRALGAQAPVQWLMDGRLQASAPAGAPVTLSFDQPGAHRLTALTRDGAGDSVAFSVVGAAAKAMR